MDESTLDVITINVGGSKFQTSRATLEKLAGTRLSNPSLMAAHALPMANNYFFDRDPLVFQYILNFHRTGELHLPSGACNSNLKKELEFWMVPEEQVSECCWKTLYGTGRDAEALRELKNHFYYDNLDYIHTFTEWKSKWKKISHTIWMFLEYPKSSSAAGIWGVLMYSLIIVSALVLFLETVISLREPDVELQRRCNATGNTVMQQMHVFTAVQSKFLLTKPLKILLYLDIFLTVLFTLEFIARLVVCPRKCKFLRGFLNVCDMLFVTSRWAAFSLKTMACMDSQELLWLVLCLKCFGVIRLLRLFRIGRSFQGFKVLLLAMKYSKIELLLLVCTFLIITMSFAIITFLAEAHSGTFINGFEAWWWAVVTMTTVGYGDLYPSSPIGRVIGSVCAVVGLVMLTLPIAVIGTNFSEFYNVNKDRELHTKERQTKCKTKGRKWCKKTLSSEMNRIGISLKTEQF